MTGLPSSGLCWRHGADPIPQTDCPVTGAVQGRHLEGEKLGRHAEPFQCDRSVSRDSMVHQDRNRRYPLGREPDQRSAHPLRQAHTEETLNAHNPERGDNDSFRHRGKRLSVLFLPRSAFISQIGQREDPVALALRL